MRYYAATIAATLVVLCGQAVGQSRTLHTPSNAPPPCTTAKCENARTKVEIARTNEKLECRKVSGRVWPLCTKRPKG